MNIVKDASLITSKVLCHLIELKDYVFIKEFLQYKYFDISYTINLLLNYNNKTKLSKRELYSIINTLNQGIIKINNKTESGNYPLLEVVSNNSIQIIELLRNMPLAITLF